MIDLEEQATHYREMRRSAFWRGLVVGAAAMLLLTTCVGCASVSAVTEFEHVSHPLAGWPCESQHLTEDGVTQVNGLIRWRTATGEYFDAGLGYNLKGRNGGGFYGPALTGTVRFGKEWRIR